MAEEREEPNLFQLIGPPIAEDQGTIYDYESSIGEKLQSGFGRQFDTNVFSSGVARPLNMLNEDLMAIAGAAEWVNADKARAEITGAGLDLTVPDNGISRYELDTLKYLKKREREQRQLSARNTSMLGTVAEFTGGLAAGLTDPLNVASAFIPIVPEARYAAWVAQSSGMFGRAAVRAGAGAIEGAAGAALLEPLAYYGATGSQLDYTAADSFINVVFGGVLGSGLHVVGGLGYDAYNAGNLDAARSIGEALPYITQREAAAAAPDSVKMEALHGAVRSLENDLPVRADETFGAWHGSPHTFDEFKIEAIGTGEGAQAVGRGFYFADSLFVAEDYLRKLRGLDASQQANIKEAIRWLRAGRDGEPQRPGALSDVKAAEDDFSYFEKRTATDEELVKYLEDDLNKNSGALYRVKLRGKKEDYPIYDSPLHGDAQAFADAAQASGAPGIRYLDQWSREAGQGTYNYVVFDPKDITVAERNGEPIAKPGSPTRPMDDPADVEVSAMADRAAMKADDLEQVAADTDFLDQQINGMKSRDMWSEADEAALAAGEDTAKKLETTASVYRAAAVCMTE